MPKVSVIIPCYNLGAYLDEAVDSVLAQTFRDFEIIIVNDGSTDESTMNLLANYNKPKTRVLHQENQGVPSARNNGIRISSGEYVCCLDADDKYHPEFLEKTVKVLDEDGAHRYGFVTTWFHAFGEKDAIWDTLDFDPWREAVSNGIHVASLFRRECWEKRGGYSVSLAGYEDWDFWLSIVAMGYEWANVKEPLFSYRVRANSKVNRSNQNRITLYRQIIRNNKDFYTSNCEDILAKFMERLSQTEVELNAIRQSLTWRLAMKAHRMLNALLPSRLKK